ncbi:MAG: response regulator transcription factor [Acidobacteriota bacterium]
MSSILIVDDHAIVRAMLADYLTQAPGIEVIAQADSAAECLGLCRAHDIELVVLDMLIPGDDCPTTIRQLKDLANPPKVLILTGARDDECSLQCMQAGADGYLCKTSHMDVLIKAIHHVTSGGKYISPDIAAKLVWSMDERGPVNHDRLSKREFQVFTMLGQGLTLTEISKRLELSIKTVSTYRSRILEKMHFKNNADLMRYSMRTGL